MQYGDLVLCISIKISGVIYHLLLEIVKSSCYPPLPFALLFMQSLLREMIKFIYSEKATKFCEIFPFLLTVCTAVKSQGKISQNFVAFSEYMNFTIKNCGKYLQNKVKKFLIVFVIPSLLSLVIVILTYQIASDT